MKFQFWWQFCHNANYNTHKSNNNHKAHAIATKETKNKAEKFQLVIQKWDLKKLVKPFLGFLPLIK